MYTSVFHVIILMTKGLICGTPGNIGKIITYILG